ncbi:MAG: hypothetical protein H6737_31170 [Alphaproteobacteria bacterium]|nr:hypothetical protein [Alphaproteobacteria bacterium]
MWWLAALAQDKPEGELPVYEDDAPHITCCPSRDAIEAPIRARLDAFRACGATVSTTAVPAKLGWTVREDGTVADIEVDLGHGEALDACVHDVIASLEHPAPGCIVIVRYPMTFAP